LDGGGDGLASIRHIVAEGIRFLSPGGWLIMEIGDDQWAAVKNMVSHTAGYGEISCVKDYAGVDRVVITRRCA
jgi:release factor glutamine methyltransferase